MSGYSEAKVRSILLQKCYFVKGQACIYEHEENFDIVTFNVRYPFNGEQISFILIMCNSTLQQFTGRPAGALGRFHIYTHSI